MKKLVRLFALAALVIMGGHAMAQTHGYMSLGATFPMGNYGNGTAEEWALTNETSTNGGASIGFNAGLKWDFGVGVPGLNVMLSVDGFYNGLNDNLKEYFYWLGVPAGEAEKGKILVAGIDKANNAVLVEKTDYSRLRIYLNDKMLDLDKPVVVRYGDRELFNAKVVRNKKTLKESLRIRNDLSFVFPAVVEVAF